MESSVRRGDPTEDAYAFLRDACAEAIESLGRLGGDGGLIAVTADGEVETRFNSDAMTRGWRVGDGPVLTAIGPDEGA